MKAIFALTIVPVCWIGGAQLAVAIFGQESNMTIIGGVWGLFMGMWAAFEMRERK